MKIKLFITGTDTSAGKTYCSVGLLNKFNRLGISTLGLKPVASGCYKKMGSLYNADALALNRASSIQVPYELTNPFAFEEAVAPHIAAKSVSGNLTVDSLVQKVNEAFNTKADVCIIEGIGGWYVPLNGSELLADFVKTLAIPVVLVVPLQMGCLNHALLTTKVLAVMQVPLIGWIGNNVKKEISRKVEIIETLKSWICAPCLGVIPHAQDPVNYIDIKPIMECF